MDGRSYGAGVADPARWQRRPGHGAYARAELERRFLLAADPPPGTAARLVEDRYVTGTGLRVRRVTAGDEQVLKLTQKVRVRPDDPSEVRLTNLYLSPQEHALLAALPHREVVKTRTVHRTGGLDVVVDVFAGRHAGLRLAEVEVADLRAPLPPVPWLGREVTSDDRWSGGALAAADDARIAELLAEQA